jgi:hypothetical protein
MFPRWTDVSDLLERHEFPVQVRMIDGELSLPDDVVPMDWRELRVSTAGGMVALKRQSECIALTIWGNADANLRQGWNALAWALAEIGQGRVESAESNLDANAFRRAAELPKALRAA